MPEDRLKDLFYRYFDKTATREEREELMSQLNTLSEEVIAELMDDVYRRFEPGKHLFPSLNRDAVLRRILKEKAAGNAVESRVYLPVRKKYGRKWMVAAAIALTAIALAWLFLDKRNMNHQSHLTRSERYRNDVPPGGEKAILTLADGTSVSLEDAGEGSLAVQGNINIRKLGNGIIAYEKTGDGAPPATLYNKLSTPRGGRFTLTLPDGTRVWLNSSSSIRYPVTFGSERLVEITGEVYLEVAKNVQKPFRVMVPGIRREGGENDPVEITVLGTHFNVMAYPEESAMKTTLLEGSVKVSRGNVFRMLKPGQQARMPENGAIRVVRDVNLEEITAWKEGYFQFDNASIETIMKQVSRWYDVEVHYKGTVPKKFSVLMLPRDLPVSRLLELLEFTGNVRFEIEGRRITVMP